MMTTHRRSRSALDRICIADPATVPDTSDCPNNVNHTPRPSGYIAFAEWASMMNRTHLQTRCPDCGLWKVWVPR